MDEKRTYKNLMPRTQKWLKDIELRRKYRENGKQFMGVPYVWEDFIKA